VALWGAACIGQLLSILLGAPWWAYPVIIVVAAIVERRLLSYERRRHEIYEMVEKWMTAHPGRCPVCHFHADAVSRYGADRIRPLPLHDCPEHGPTGHCSRFGGEGAR
jgi:hypothetical protein